MKDTFALTAVSSNASKDAKLPQISTSPHHLSPANKENSPSLISRINSRYDRSFIERLKVKVISMKKQYNSLYYLKLQKEVELADKKQLLSQMDDQLEFAVKQEKIQNRARTSKELTRNLLLQKNTTKELEHMASLRQKSLGILLDKFDKSNSTLRNCTLKAEKLHKSAQMYSASLENIRRSLESLEVEVNEENENRRKDFSQELASLHSKSETVTYYNQLRDTWHTKQQLISKQNEINALEQYERSLQVEQELQNSLTTTQAALKEREERISATLDSTNTISLDELLFTLSKFQQSKVSLRDVQSEIENIISRQSSETHNLVSTYSHSLATDQYSNSGLYSLEQEFHMKTSSLNNRMSDLKSLQATCSSITLLINRLIHQVSFSAGNNRPKTSNSLKTSLKFLLESARTILGK